MIETWLLAFIPLFVAIDIMGVIPLFLSLTGAMGEPARRKLIRNATITAFAVAVVFLFFGRLIFQERGQIERNSSAFYPYIIVRRGINHRFPYQGGADENDQSDEVR